jgi:DNA-directed RNA polymerase subunit RPC12/RpoP
MHKTVPFRVHAALRLLQYAGIISSRGPKKITDRDTAEMYLVHPAILVRENALFVGEINPSLEAIVSALNEPLRERFREFTKNSPRLLDFRQDEQPTGVECPKCSFLVAESAKFCSNCGYRIEQPSPLQELRACGVEQLELTQGIKQRVIADGRFSTVGSIIDATDDQLDSIAWIGLSRVALIRYAADEFLAG